MKKPYQTSLLLIGIFILFTGATCSTDETTNTNTNAKTDTTEIVEVIENININENINENLVEVEKTNLFAVGNYTGDGTATRIYDEKEFTHTVTANIDDPADGKFYEGWLVTKTPSLDFISTGELTKDGDSYILEFTSPEDQSAFNEVVITEETSANGLDGVPEDHVLEGEF